MRHTITDYSLRFALCLVMVFTFYSCDRAKREYQDATSMDTVAAYSWFIAQYPDHELAGFAKKRMAGAAYRNLIGQTKSAPYLDFLKQYPDSDDIQQVKDKIEQLLYIECIDKRNTVACDDYLRLFEGQARHPDVIQRRQEIVFAYELEMAMDKNTFEAYQEFIFSHPEQDQVVMFDGGIGGLMNAYIKLDKLCPHDRQDLEALAAKEGVPMSKVKAFPGFFVGPPPKAKMAKGKTSSIQQTTKRECYPIPQWTAQKLGLFETSVSSEGGRMYSYMNFGSSADKIFTFVGRKVGDKYHVVAAKLKNNAANQGDKQ